MLEKFSRCSHAPYMTAPYGFSYEFLPKIIETCSKTHVSHILTVLQTKEVLRNIALLLLHQNNTFCHYIRIDSVLFVCVKKWTKNSNMILTRKKHLSTVHVLKFGTLYSIMFLSWILLLMQLFLKILSGMANSVDQDQAAVSSGSMLFAYAILSETLVYEILG